MNSLSSPRSLCCESAGSRSQPWPVSRGKHLPQIASARCCELLFPNCLRRGRLRPQTTHTRSGLRVCLAATKRNIGHAPSTMPNVTQKKQHPAIPPLLILFSQMIPFPSLRLGNFLFCAFNITPSQDVPCLFTFTLLPPSLIRPIRGPVP